MDRAACLGLPPDVMFPTNEASRQRGRATCAGCPVRVECTDYAVAEGIDHGTFGGLTPGERAALAGAA